MGDLEYLARIANGELSSGVLKTFVGINNTTEILATVPGGKDWYLMGSSIIASGAANGNTKLEYPTGTIIQEINNGTVGLKNEVIGIPKGLKITAAQTVTITKGIASGTVTVMQVLEVDIGVSPALT